MFIPVKQSINDDIGSANGLYQQYGYELLPTTDSPAEDTPITTIGALLSKHLIQIGNHLDVLSLARAGMVCRLWRETFETHLKWKDYYMDNQYPYEPVAKGADWKRLYSEPRSKVRAFGRNLWQKECIHLERNNDLFAIPREMPISTNGVEYSIQIRDSYKQLEALENGKSLWSFRLPLQHTNYFEVNNTIGGVLLETESVSPSTAPGELIFQGDLYLWDCNLKTTPKKVANETSQFVLLGDKIFSITESSLYVHSLESSRLLYNTEDLGRVRWMLPNMDSNLLYLIEAAGCIRTYCLTQNKIISKITPSFFSSDIQKAISYSGAIFILDKNGILRFNDPRKNIDKGFYQDRPFKDFTISRGVVISQFRFLSSFGYKIYPSETRTPATFFSDLFKKN